MSSTESTGTFSSGVLIGDSNVPTTVDSVTISSCLELQSSDSALTLPRMTTTQLSALTVPINGMIAYDNVLKTLVKYDSITPGFISAQGKNSIASISVLGSEITRMYGTPKLLIAATGAGTAIIPFKATLVYENDDGPYAGNGTIQIQYGNTVHAGGQNAFSSTIDNSFLNDNFKISVMTLNSSLINIAAPENTGLYITNDTGTFDAVNGGSSVTINIWYNVINLT